MAGNATPSWTVRVVTRAALRIARCLTTRTAMRGATHSVAIVMLGWIVGGPAATLLAQEHPAVAAVTAVEPQRVTIDVHQAPLVTVINLIAQQAGLTPSYVPATIPVNARVTLHVMNVPVGDAFRQALQGTGLIAQIRAEGDVAIVRDAKATAGGTIVGLISDEKTKLPLRGATVVLDNASRGILTGEDGSFRLANVPAGNHRVTARLIGYLKRDVAVVVVDGETVTADMKLAASINTLDQVVVTGTVIPVERRAVPSAITVITAKQIEQRGITHIDQLFRGDVPGLFAVNTGSSSLLDEVTMFSRGATRLPSDGFAASSNPIKTYVDGVELADPQYLSQIDPKSIERIEILTGPQASTIYGSNAINGVMQIFTKRGQSQRPRFTATAMTGTIENNFSSKLTPQHDVSVQLDGMQGQWSYNAGGSWTYAGPWTPAKQTTRTDGFAAGRVTLEKLTIDGSLRIGKTQTGQHGLVDQGTTYLTQIGYYAPTIANGAWAPGLYTLNGQTLGLTMGFNPVHWWSSELSVGRDVSEAEDWRTDVGYTSPDDSLLTFGHYSEAQTSTRFSTTATIPVGTIAKMTMTGGADGWEHMSTVIQGSGTTLKGSIGSPFIDRIPSHNSGAFLQGQLAIVDQLFLTYGLRAEWNPYYGKDQSPNLSPRYGAAYTHEIETPLGEVTAKIRASYGSATRPPTVGQKLEGRESGFIATYFGPYISQRAAPDLGPEYQQGGEGGVELYFGNRGSLEVTRYNQTVDGLIGRPKVDSVPPLPQYAPFIHQFAPVYQNVNIGNIRNQGWELHGTLNFGPFQTQGTYSWNKSRFLGITPAFRARFSPDQYPQYQPGASFALNPEHTWALGLGYAVASTSLSLNVNGTGFLYRGSDALTLAIGSGLGLTPPPRLRNSSVRMSIPNGYMSIGPGYAMADFNASHRFSSHIEGVLQVQNLTNFYQNDARAEYASIGRQTKIGVRTRW